MNLEIKNKLVQRACEVRKHSYSPYSNFAVGAALLTPDNKIFTGTNVENAVYPVGICAERAAVAKAVSEGEKEFIAIAIVGSSAISPCGSCRQVLYEFNPKMLVILADEKGEIEHEIILEKLLPLGFGPKDLMS